MCSDYKFLGGSNLQVLSKNANILRREEKTFFVSFSNEFFC